MTTHGTNDATSNRRGLLGRLRRKPDPVPPENVRLLLSDGSTIPLEMRYLGRNDGIDAWEAVLRVAIPEGMGWGLEVDMLPAYSSITVNTTETLTR